MLSNKRKATLMASNCDILFILENRLGSSRTPKVRIIIDKVGVKISLIMTGPDGKKSGYDMGIRGRTVTSEGNGQVSRYKSIK